MTVENSKRWRVGKKVPINVYDGDRPVCQCQTAQDAKQIVQAMNTFTQYLTHTCGTPVETAVLQHDVAIYVWCPSCRDIVEAGELSEQNNGNRLVRGSPSDLGSKTRNYPPITGR